MSQPQVVISESVEELKRLLGQQRQGKRKERVQALYLLKSEQVTEIAALARLLGRDLATVYRWLQRYRSGGLKRLLELDYRHGGRSSVCSAPVRAALAARLADPEQGFASYRAVQAWLGEDYGLQVKYPTLHRLVRYRLKAKLKVARPRHVEQSTAAVVEFKKKSAPALGHSARVVRG